MSRTSPRKMQDYRDRLRARGLRPLQVWVPDTGDRRIRNRIRRQARFLYRQPPDVEIDSLSDATLIEIEGWTA